VPPSESEFIRFRIDASLRAQASDVCNSLGLDLNDVLRALVARIARDGALPFDLQAPSVSAAGPTPFATYDMRLWASLAPIADAEAAMTMLAVYVARCGNAIDDEYQRAAADNGRIELLTQQLHEAQRAQQELDLTDPAVAARVLATYRARLTELEAQDGQD
jgi:addiction module RelB/DinJ family antitoxin